MSDTEKYMKRALELAALGAGQTYPNPMVGAVIVHNGRIIGEGYHHKYGEPHAEVMAIRSVSHPELLDQSTLYVTLEPCAHHGKTPPCATLLIKHKIHRIVIAMQDPFPQVSGKGIALLKEAGLEVMLGVLEHEARRLNKVFIARHTLNRPIVSLKWAQSQDGFIDVSREDSSSRPYIFSNELRLREIHHERSLHQSILIGFKTALLDNPSLTNRYWTGSNPIRIILDPHLSLPKTIHLFRDGLAPTWIIHQAELTPPDVTSKHLRYLPIQYTEGWIEELLKLLHNEGINSLIVEGGSKTLQTFIDHHLYDSIECETSPCLLYSGVPAPRW